MDDGAQVHAALTFEAQVSRMMRSFPDDASIQVWGTHAIRAQIWDDVNNIEFKDRLGQAGACAALVTALVTHRPNATVQASGLQAVCSLAIECSANCRRFQDAGIGTALLATMRTHAADAGVQDVACLTMAHLAYSVGCAEVERAFRSAAAGAIDVLAEVLRAHVQHRSVPCQALHALAAMAARRYGPVDVTLPHRLHAAQVAQAVVAAMRIDVAHEDLQAAAASAIESMAERNNGAGAAAIAQQFLDAGAGEALKEALAASTIGGATSDTLKALTALAHYGAGAAQLLAAGVAEAIVAAVDRHCTRGGMLRADYGSKWVLSQAISAIATLAASAPADSARLSSAGACAAVASSVLLLNNVQRSDVTDYFELLPGLKALAALAAAGESHSQAVAHSLVQAGACEATTAVLKAVLLKPPQAAGQSDLLTSVLRTICSLSTDAGAAALLTAAGAREAVASAIPRCANDDDAAAQAAQLALDRLA